MRELVVRDVNHPSVIFWDNGNEGGFNYDLVDDYRALRPAEAPRDPPVAERGRQDQHHALPRLRLLRREVPRRAGARHAHGGPARPLRRRPRRGARATSGAGCSRSPLAVGAFLWVLADEGVVRTDRDGALDTDGNHAPDGIVGPYREKEASFFTIKDVWSPVFLELGRLDRLPPTFDGRLRVENRYDFTDLDPVSFEWRLVRFAGPESADGGPHRRRAGHDTRAAPRPRRPWHPRAGPPGGLARLRRALPDGQRPAGPRHQHLDVDDEGPRRNPEARGLVRRSGRAGRRAAARFCWRRAPPA